MDKIKFDEKWLSLGIGFDIWGVDDFIEEIKIFITN